MVIEEICLPIKSIDYGQPIKLRPVKRLIIND